MYICYDRHFPEGARALGLNGAEIVFNPSATVARPLASTCGSSSSPRTPSRTATSSATINRVGSEEPWDDRRVLRPELLRATRAASSSASRRPTTRTSSSSRDLDLDMIHEVRNTWQFYRDRRPDAYGDLVAP